MENKVEKLAHSDKDIPKAHLMTTEEIQQYIDEAIHSNFKDVTSQSGEMMTSPEGDGRFLGKVFATLYSGLPKKQAVYLAIGGTEKKRQIIKLGDSECLSPSQSELDLLLMKELGIGAEDDDTQSN